MYQHVHDRRIYWRWSPQQIADRLYRMYPDDPGRQVSHETIYASIYAQPRGGLKRAMIEALRQEKPVRGRRRTTLASGGSFVPEALRIVHRPEEIATRQWPGHWEGDLVKGAFNRSCVGTLARELKLDIWFCDPHAPWQRGSNENFNGLLRQFLPKGMDLSNVTQTPLNDIAKLLNGRPRMTLGWDTPEEATAKELERHQLAKRCTGFLRPPFVRAPWGAASPD